MRLSMNKQDICEPIEIPREKFKEMLGEVIKATIIGEEHLGDNLKKQCVNYIDELNLYRKVIEKVREVTTDLYNIIYNSEYEKFGLSRDQYRNRFKKLLQILDKVKE